MVQRLSQLANGDLLTCWFHGSGERTADDVVVRGARLAKGRARWSAPFLMADTPGYPDTNSTMFVDPMKRLWLLWPTILANEWQTALMKYRIASSFGPGWKSEVGRQRGAARHARRRVRDDRQCRSGSHAGLGRREHCG